MTSSHGDKQQPIPSPRRICLTLLLIIATVEAIIMTFLPLVMPATTNDTLQDLADALLLAIISAPFIWRLVAEPLRHAAINEISRTQAVVEHIVDAVINFDEHGRIESLNQAAVKMFGYPAAEIIGQPISTLIPGLQPEPDRVADDDGPLPQDSVCRLGYEGTGCRKDGSCIPMDITVSTLLLDGRATFIAIIDDISGRKQAEEKRKRYEEQLEYQTNHDGLTTLPNRNLLADRIRQALLLAHRNQQEVAVLLADVDNFKLINDTLGHDIGDHLLKLVAERLTAAVRAGDTVARQGADEFVIVLCQPAIADNLTPFATKLLEAIAQPFRILEHELIVTCSLGISIYPRDGEEVQALIKNAEVAMRRAKEQGHNTFQFFTGEMNARSLVRLTMERHLRRALEHDELLLYYQPKVNLASGRMTSMEALIRWQSPELGMVSPVNFIPLAEETGMIEPIGEWVLRTACRQNKIWQEAGLPPLSVAVNLSARQFRQQEIATLIARVLRESGLDPRWLELEITESMVMRDVERVRETLHQLKSLGTTLAMDDFGTGYSSLSYLKRFPFDKLKIDQSFVRDITSAPDNAAIAQAVTAMAHSLQLKVIAEGVETVGQLHYLRDLGCDEMQGFYFSRPLPAADFEALLLSGRRLPIATSDQPSAEKSLLVVDDEKDVLASLQRLFLLDGYRVLTAMSAAEGFEVLAENRVAVVISDQRMPLMTGTEFLGRVKALHPHTVRVVLSGHADLASVTDAINHGAVYKFLHKPWDDDRLREVVKDAFHHAEEMAAAQGGKANAEG